MKSPHNKKSVLIVAIAFVFASCVLLFLFPSTKIFAASCEWTGAINENWEEAGNWSNCSGGVPASSDSVVIDADLVVYINQPTTITSLTLGNSNGDNVPVLIFNYDGVGSGALTISGGDFVVYSGARISHTQANLDTIVGRININVTDGDTFIYGTGRIEADWDGYAGGGSGHLNGYGPGGGIGGTDCWTGAGGGGYGGAGEKGKNGAVPGGTAYGWEMLNGPIELGSGGGYNSCHQPGKGGGAIKLVVNGSLTVDGQMSANGQHAATAAGAGAGGSIWIDVNGSISGTGTIVANGGIDNDSEARGGQGSGGRVYIKYSDISLPIENISADGGYRLIGGTSEYYGEDGSVIFIDRSNSHMYINKAQRWVPYNTSAYESLFPEVTDMIVSAVLKLESNNRTSDAADGYGWNLSLNNLTVTSTGSLYGSDLGYRGGSTLSSHNNGYGPGGGVGNTANWGGAGGGGYGGDGKAGNTSAGGFTYDWANLVSPALPGSGGGTNYNNHYSGSGGSAVKLEISGTLDLDGTINMNGGNGLDVAGGGSGGSVWIVVNNLTGDGSISADGGGGGNNSNRGGDGGGGRVSIRYKTNTLAGTITANKGNLSRPAENGTVVLVNDSNKNLTISQTQRWVAADENGFRYMLPDILSMNVTNNSTLYLEAGNRQTESNGYGWTIRLDDFVIDEGSAISANGLGYKGGNSTHPNGYGPGGGIGHATSWYGTGGGGYGGNGANGDRTAGGSEYDFVKIYAPTSPGSGGGAAASAGYSGGGAFKLSAKNSVTVNGSITANGQDGSYVSGGGSGGSIWIICESINVGASGAITANGGNGGTDSNRGGAGAGGRIAIQYKTSGTFDPLADISANGGTLPATRVGGIGTVTINQAIAGYLVNLDTELEGLKKSDWNTDLTNPANAQVALTDVGVKDKDDGVISSFTLFFDGNRDMSGVTAGTDENQKKSFFHVPGGYGTIDGFDMGYPDFDLYIPRGNSDSVVYICPGVDDLSEISSECPGVMTFQEGDANVSTQTIDGQLYWVVSGMENTGGLSYTSNNMPQTAGISGASNLYAGKIYTLTTTYSDPDGASHLDQMHLQIQNPSGTNIEYYASNGEDATGVAPTVVSGGEYIGNISYDRDISNPDANSVTITWHITMDWDWVDSSNVEFGTKAIDDATDETAWSFTDDDYIYENDLAFYGSLLVKDSLGNSLISGSWVRPSESLSWEGVRVVYEGTSNIYPSDDDFDVLINDDDDGSWSQDASSGSDISITTTVDSQTDVEDIHSVSIVNTKAGASGASIDFTIRVDGMGPSNVSGLAAVAISTSGIRLNWTSPIDPDFEMVKIVRSTSTYPTNPLDGEIVYEGGSNNFTDEGLATGTKYYYTVFAFDEIGNSSSGAVISASTDEDPVEEPSDPDDSNEDEAPSDENDDQSQEDTEQTEEKEIKEVLEDFGIDTQDLEIEDMELSQNQKPVIIIVDGQMINYTPGVSDDVHIFPGSQIVLRIPEEMLIKSDTTLLQVLLHTGQNTYLMQRQSDGYYQVSFDTVVTEEEVSLKVLSTYANNTVSQLDLIFKVDPYGYIYQRQDGNQLRLKDAKVSLYTKVGETAQLWRSTNQSKYPNPQITDKNGEYAFLVENGEYKIEVELEGYQKYESEWFEVQNRIVQMNIEMEEDKIGLWVYILISSVLASFIYMLYMFWKRNNSIDSFPKSVSNSKR